MNVLIVGAGAVGQVYARHLQQGGASVHYLVKPKHKEETLRGFVFYPLNRLQPRAKVERLAVTPEQVLTSPAEVAKIAFDQVYLCMPSPALRGPWLDELIPAIGKATLVMLQPGFEDRDYVLARFPAERLVAGMITLVSYHAPLPGEQVPEPGTAYMFPPLVQAPYSGRRAASVVKALRAGAMPARVDHDISERVVYPSAVLMTFLCALEQADWSLQKLRAGDRLALARKGAEQAIAVIAKERGTTPPAILSVATPGPMRLALTLAPHFLPFDLETYLKVHFTKVHDQTEMFMDNYIRLANQHGVPADALIALRTARSAEAPRHHEAHAS